MLLRQSTSQTVRFGPFFDSTDFITAETALTIAQADMQLSKDGGAFAQKNASGNATHDTDGWYSTTLNATDTDTVGELILQVSVTGAIPVWQRWYVVDEKIYDALFDPGANGFDSNGRVDVGTWLGTAVATSNIAIKDTLAKTTHITGFNDLSAANVNAEVDTALADIHLDHLLAADYDPASKPGVSTALLNELVENDGGVSRLTANALEQGPISDATAANQTSISSDIAALNDLSAAQVNVEVADVLKTDTVSEVAQQAPPATPTLEEAIMYIYMALRNKVDVTSTTMEFHNDAGTVIWKKTLSDDGTTYSEAEGATGP